MTARRKREYRIRGTAAAKTIRQRYPAGRIGVVTPLAGGAVLAVSSTEFLPDLAEDE